VALVNCDLLLAEGLELPLRVDVIWHATLASLTASKRQSTSIAVGRVAPPQHRAGGASPV